MFEREKIAELLRGNAELYAIVAELYSDEAVADELGRLAQHCREIALSLRLKKSNMH